MPFQFKIEPAAKQKPHSIILSGHLTLGPQLLVFSRAVAEHIATCHPSGILLHMGAIEDVDSSGLGELVILYTTCGQYHCRLCLLNPTPRTIHLLETTRLSGILPHFESEAEASAWVLGEA